MINTEYKVNKGQIGKIHVLLGQLPGLGDKAERAAYKEGLVRDFTDGRETSTTKLTWKEAKDMIAALEQAINNGSMAQCENSSMPKDAGKKKAKPGDGKRKRILSLAHQMGWYVGVNNLNSSMTQWLNGSMEAKEKKLDMERIDNWCKTYGKYGKALDDHTTEELSVLITQIEKVYESYLNGV